MKEVITQLYAVPADAWYATFVLIGSMVYAIFTESASAGQAVKGLVLGLFGGGVTVLLLTAYLPTLNPRAMVALAGLSGFFGNFLLHAAYDRRTMFGGFIDRYLRSRYGGGDPPTNTEKP